MTSLSSGQDRPRRLSRRDRTPPNAFAIEASISCQRRSIEWFERLRAAHKAAAAERRAQRDERMARRAARKDASNYAKARAAELAS